MQDARAEYTSVSLDTGMAKQRLNGAKTAMENGNLQEADNALAAIQEGVELTTVTSEMPLLKGRQNLALAKSMAQQGRPAKRMLQAVSDALAEYEVRHSALHANEAANLRQEIDTSTGPVSADKIDRWWNQVAGWMSQSPTTKRTTP